MSVSTLGEARRRVPAQSCRSLDHAAAYAADHAAFFLPPGRPQAGVRELCR